MPVPFVPNPILMPGYAATGFAAPNVAGAAGAGAAGLSALNIVGIGLMAGSLIYSIIKGPTKVEGPRLDDFQVNDSSYDIPIALLFGKGRLSGNIIWPADNGHADVNLIREEKKTYKKGGFLGIGGVKYTEYRYYGTFSISFCEGPATSILTIWGGDRVIFDISDSAEAEDAAYSRQLLTDGKIAIYYGTATQAVSALMVSREGLGNVPAYRDVVRIDFDDIPLADFDNQIPQVTSLITKGTSGGISTHEWDQISNTLVDSFWFTTNRSHLEIVYHNNNYHLIGRIAIGAEELAMPMTSKNGIVWQSDNYWNLYAAGFHTLSDTFAVCSYNNALYYFGNGTDWVYVSPGSHRWGEIHRRTSGGITSTIRFSLRDPGAIAFNPGTLYGNLIWIFEGNSFWSTSDSGLQMNRSGDYTGGMLFTLRNADAGIGTRSFPSLISHISNLYIIGGEETGGSLRHNGVWRVNLNVNPPTFTLINAELSALGTASYRVYRAISYTPINSSTARLAALAKRISNSKFYIFESTDAGVSWKVANDYSWAVAAYTNSSGNTLIKIAGDKTDYIDVDSIIQISGSAASDEIYTATAVSYDSGASQTIITVAGTIDPTSGTIYLYKFDLLDASEFSSSLLPAFSYINGSFFVYGGYNVSGYGNKAFMTRENFSATDTTTVASVITEICERAGLTASDIDVTDLTSDTLHGYIIKDQSSAWSMLEPLRQAFFFDPVEGDGKIKFIKRGGASVATLTSADLGARKSGAAPTNKIEHKRIHDLELPKRIDVSYFDVEREYEPSTQTYQLNQSNAQDAFNLRIPIAMTAAKAAQIAEVAMYEFWASRNILEFTTLEKWDWLEPTDVITINETDLDGNVTMSRLVRLTEKDSEGGIIRWSAVQERSEIYAPVATGTSVAPNSSNFISSPSTLMKVFQHPILDMAHNDFGVSVACGSIDSRWPGATIEMSTDDGVTYESVEDSSKVGTFGIVVSAVGQPTNYLDWDKRNVIDVDLTCGTLASATEAEVRAGKNLFYYGSEMVGATTVASLGSNRYRLSNLLRGLYGTEWAIDSHQAGESIVLMQDLVRIPLDASFNQKNIYFRAQTFGDNQYVYSQFVIDDVGMKPYSPVHVIASRFSEAKIINGRTYAAGSWKLSWMRRARAVTNWNNLPIPINEDREEYEIDFLDTDGTTVLHTQEIAALDLREDQKPFFILPAATFTYYDAEGIEQTQYGQDDIYNGIANAIIVKIYQKSAAAGRGYAASHTFTA